MSPRMLRSRRVVAPLVVSSLLACGGGPPPVSTRQITGARQVTVWPDTGKGGLSPTVDSQDPATTVTAWSVDGKTHVTGTLDRTGAFKIDGAPTGPYLLEFHPGTGGRWFIRTEASIVDLSHDLLGHAGVRYPNQPTAVTFDLAGLVAADPQDLVEMTCSNASLWERLVPQNTLSPGVTSWSAPFAWAARPSPLVSGQAGDIVYVNQLSTRVDPGTGLTYQAATRWASTVLTVTDGFNLEVPVTLSPTTSSGRLSAFWRLSQFEATLADFPPGSQVNQHTLYIEGIAWGLDLGPEPRVGNPDLLHASASPSTPDAMLDLSYGRFLPPLWKERLTATMTIRQQFPFQGGTVAYSSSISIQSSMDAPPAELAPTIGPVRNVRINDQDASRVLTGVGSGPIVSWTAPRSGVPDYYAASLSKMTSNGGQISFTHIATLYTAETRAQFPEGTLSAGTQVVASVMALRMPTSHYQTAPAPFRRYFPRDYAQVATAPFLP